MNMSEYFNLPEFNLDLLYTAIVKSYANKMVCFFVSYKYGIKYGLLNCADFSYH